MTTTTGDALASDSPERQQRFEALLREHRRIVFHVAHTYAGNTDERHDLVQEICSQLWRAFPRYDESRRFSTWMYRIALNTGISHLRQAGARAARFEALSDDVLEATLDVEAARGRDLVQSSSRTLNSLTSCACVFGGTGS